MSTWFMNYQQLSFMLPQFGQFIFIGDLSSFSGRLKYIYIFKICLDPLQGMDLRQDLRRGIIMGNQSLVLQSLGRNATGNYYCVATNAEGTAFSNAAPLDIKCKQIF